MQAKMKHLMLAPGWAHASWLIQLFDWRVKTCAAEVTCTYIQTLRVTIVPQPILGSWKESFATSKDARLIYSGHQGVGVGLWRYGLCSACSSCPAPIAKKEDIVVYSRPGLKATHTKQGSHSSTEPDKSTSNFQKLSNAVQQFLSWDCINLPDY